MPRRWSFDSGDHVLNWDEGTEGKGLVDDHGNVHTWDAEEYGTHQEYMQEHGIESADEYFWITPNGRVTVSGIGALNSLQAEIIQEADPRLHCPADEPVWQF